MENRTMKNVIIEFDEGHHERLPESCSDLFAIFATSENICKFLITIRRPFWPVLIAFFSSVSLELN